MARVVLAVGGSIAAYKAVDLTSKLVQAGHDVEVLMSAAAARFVRPLSFTALTHRRVWTDAAFWDAAGDTPGVAAHLRLTDGADLFVAAPCTANTMARFAHGLADEIVSATYLGCGAPVLIAPAMNERMWRHPRTQANLATLREDGVHVVGPATGFLAEGETGPGRMAEPAEVLAEIGRLTSRT